MRHKKKRVSKLSQAIKKAKKKQNVSTQLTSYGGMSLFGEAIQKELKEVIAIAKQVVLEHKDVESKYGYGEMYIAGVQGALDIVTGALAEADSQYEQINAL